MLDDDVTPSQAEAQYEEYKKSVQGTAFFENHKEDEWYDRLILFHLLY